MKISNEISKNKEKIDLENIKKIVIFPLDFSPSNFKLLNHIREIIVVDSMVNYLEYLGFSVEIIVPFFKNDRNLIIRSELEEIHIDQLYRKKSDDFLTFLKTMNLSKNWKISDENFNKVVEKREDNFYLILRLLEKINKNKNKESINCELENIKNQKIISYIGELTQIRDDFRFDGEKLNLIRYYFLSHHYRSPVKFSENGLLNSEKALNKLSNFYHFIENSGDEVIDEELSLYFSLIDKYLENDFNFSAAIGLIHKIRKKIMKSKKFPGISFGIKLKKKLKNYMVDILKIVEDKN